VFKKTPTSRPSEMGVVIKMGVAPQECEKCIPNVWKMNHRDLLNTMI